jgi:hypothetical protein
MAALEQMGDEVLWPRIKQELAGIQLMWTSLDGLFFRANDKPGLSWLHVEVTLLSGLMQSSMMESLLLRIARLMDPPAAGKGNRGAENLSLRALAEAHPSLTDQVNTLKGKWEESDLKRLRDKYLSHNDLKRAQSEQHTINMPMTAADIAGVSSLVDGLMEFRKTANHVIVGAAYLDGSLTLSLDRQLDTLDRMLTIAFRAQSGHGLEEVTGT